MTTQKQLRLKTEDSIVMPFESQLKYSQLQNKYINVLERANFYLENALQTKKEEQSESKNRAKSQSNSKIST
jgi:hypothetical protein